MTKEQTVSRPKARSDSLVRGLVSQLIFFGMGLICSRAVVFGQYAPLGVALAAAAPNPLLWGASMGAALGYLLPGAARVPVHYLAALLAAGAIRWALSDVVKERWMPILSGAAAGLSVLCTSLCVAVVNGLAPGSVAMFLAESLLAGGWGYFFSRTCQVLWTDRAASGMLPQDLCCTAFSVGALLLAFSGVEAGGISLGRILAVMAILFAARYGGATGGAVAGVAAGAAFSLSTAGLNYLSGAYALGGLMAGLFSPMGRLAAACAFILSNAVASLQVGNASLVFSGLYEVGIATVVFMVLPARAGGKLLHLFARRDDAPRTDSLRRSMVARLDFTAQAMDGVADTVKEVGMKLDEAEMLRAARLHTPLPLPEKNLARSLLVQQFATVSAVLEEMASDLELYERCDFDAARVVREVLRDFGLVPVDVNCRVDRFGRMKVESLAARGSGGSLNKAQLAQELSRTLDRRFDAPGITRVGANWRLVFGERARYRVLAGSARHSCENSPLCGDSFQCFPDGAGHQIAIISDGMGSGGRAAVDGSMAAGILTDLLKAGIGFDSALKMVNSALVVKSGDESLATLDVLSLDLYTGMAEFYKAGAPVSFLRRNGQTVPVDAPGIPVGILEDAQFHKTNETVGSEDLVVLVSDGALAPGTTWIAQLIAGWDNRMPQELAEAIVAGAVSRRADGHDDDITALVFKLIPNE